MQTKSIVEVEPGDIVGQPVYDGSGNALVHEGVELTPTLIKVLERRGVTEVLIRTGDDTDMLSPTNFSQPKDPLAAHKLAESRERLNLAFHRHEGNLTMAMLYKAAFDYFTDKYAD